MKNRIKVLRAERGMTQEQLAKQAGISRNALSMIEAEKVTPDGATIARLVKALQVPADQIFLTWALFENNKQKGDVNEGQTKII